MFDREVEEINDEIGELQGLENELLDSLGMTRDSSENELFGSFVSTSSLPADWKEQIAFFNDFEQIESSAKSILRGGKTAEQGEFEMLLKEVEIELQAAAKRNPRRFSI